MITTLTWKNSIISALLAGAALLSAWFILLSKPIQPVISDTLSNQPDSYMEGVTATIMNKEGVPALKIQSTKMVHYPSHDTTYITQPHVTIYRQTPQPWYVDSDLGKAINGIERIVFSNHVVIHHPADKINPMTTMETTSLDVFPNQQQAKTAEAVTITQPDTIVHAIGMLANLEDGTVQLLSKAKGDYVPSS